MSLVVASSSMLSSKSQLRCSTVLDPSTSRKGAGNSGNKEDAGNPKTTHCRIKSGSDIKCCVDCPERHPESDTISLIAKTPEFRHRCFVALTATMSGQCPATGDEEIAPRQRLGPREILERSSVPIDFVPFSAVETGIHGVCEKMEVVVADHAGSQDAFTLLQQPRAAWPGRRYRAQVRQAPAARQIQPRFHGR